MLTSLEDVRPGWSVRVIAGLRRAPSWEEWKQGNVPLGAHRIEVTATIRRIHRVPLSVERLRENWNNPEPFPGAYETEKE